jgi:hypothetical protein
LLAFTNITIAHTPNSVALLSKSLVILMASGVRR